MFSIVIAAFFFFPAPLIRLLMRVSHTDGAAAGYSRAVVADGVMIDERVNRGIRAPCCQRALNGAALRC